MEFPDQFIALLLRADSKTYGGHGMKARVVLLAAIALLIASGSEAARLVFANQSTAANRRVYCWLVDVTDGMTPETGEAGGQPQVSTNGAAWTDTGIGTLTHIGNGRYYADLAQTLVATAETWISVRYKSANTAEGICESAHVVGFDPATALATASAVAGVQASVDAVDDYVDGEVAAIQAKTANLPASPAATGDIPSAATIAAAVLDEQLSGHTTAGSAGKKLADIPTTGTAPSVADISEGVWTYEPARSLTSINAQTQVFSRVGIGRRVTLVRNDDHALEDDNAVIFTRETWRDLSDATEIRMTVRNRRTDAVIFTLTDREASRVTGEGSQTVVFEPSAEDTADLVPGELTAKYDVQATLASGHIYTLELTDFPSGIGGVDVLPDQTRP
jgi:hypothetical protein